jgi:tetratricopeptide (TPR) repeat protein
MIFAQFPTKQKPKLIRDTEAAEGKETTDSSAPKKLNPLLCDRDINIGNQYYKKKNYDGAISRYLEALEYQPNSVKAYDALTRAYEKKGDQEKAAETYREFIKKFPESPKVKEFQARLAALGKKTK